MLDLPLLFSSSVIRPIPLYHCSQQAISRAVSPSRLKVVKAGKIREHLNVLEHPNINHLAYNYNVKVPMGLHANIFQAAFSAINVCTPKNRKLGTRDATTSIFTDIQAALKIVIAYTLETLSVQGT